mgnify:CR=1 FL=1
MNQVLSQDMREAAVDAILAALGHSPKAMHPLAVKFGDTPLSNIAAMCGHTGHASNTDRRYVVSRGISTGDFAGIVATAAQTFAVRRYEKAASHLAFTGTIEAKDFQPVDIADISIGTALQRVGEYGEVQMGRVTMQNASSGQLASFANNLLFSRELVINDQASLIQTALAAYGAAAAQTEAKLVYTALRENPTLSDGMPVFHAEFGNLFGSFDENSNFANALAALRRGMTMQDDDISDLDAAHLIVSADMEYRCKKTVHEAGMGDQILVTATAHLPTGEWFLLPDAGIQPVVSAIRLAGSKTPVRLEPQKTPVEVDGFTIRAGSDLGAAMVSRHAIRGVA